MYAQMVMERLCAVMAGTDVHAVAAQYLADIVGMYLVYGKGNDAGMVILPVRTQHLDVRNRLHAPEQIRRQFLFHSMELVHAVGFR